MTHTARVKHIVGVAFVAAALLASPTALAQTTRTPYVGGAVREYQTAPPVRPTRPPRQGVTGLGSDNQGVIREPRFIVEAVSFKAVDESGRTDLGSDEVFAVFSNGRDHMITKVYGSVDDGDEERFETAQSCIWPVAATSQRGQQGWACAPEGARGAVSFGIKLYDLDPDYPDEVFTGHFCVRPGYFGSTDPCSTQHSSLLFDASFSYGVSQILSRLDPACRCFEETASQSMNNARYEVTFRITRVDTGGEPLSVDRDPGPTGPAVYRSGTLSAALNQRFEFDDGTVVNAGGDFAFTRTGFATYLLTPNGGAKVWPGGATARGYDTCYAQRASANYLTTMIPAPTAGQHACYVTSDGRVGEFRVDNLTQGTNATMTISYTTWQ